MHRVFSPIVVLLSLKSCFSSKLNIVGVSCENGYSISARKAKFECEGQCAMGGQGNMSGVFKYTNISSFDMYMDSSFSFTAWANSTFKQLTGGYSPSQQLSFTEYYSMCSGDACDYDDGKFGVMFGYDIPSTGMNMFYEGFNITAEFLFRSEDSGNVIGDCIASFTTIRKKSNKNYDYDDYSNEDDYDEEEDVTYIYANAGYYAKCFFFAAAAFVGVYAGKHVYSSNNVCKKYDLRDDTKTTKLLAESVSVSCNTDDVDRLQEDIQNRILIFKEKVPWPQIDTSKLVHEESLPWPEDTSYFNSLASFVSSTAKNKTDKTSSSESDESDETSSSSS